MFLVTQARIQQAAREFAQRSHAFTPNIVVNQPPRPAMGDLALPLAMELGRRAGKPPRQVADELAAELRAVAGVARVEIAGPGYVNVYLARTAYATGLEASAPAATPPADKIIVEHTNINPNKAAHIGPTPRTLQTPECD